MKPVPVPCGWGSERKPGGTTELMTVTVAGRNCWYTRMTVSVEVPPCATGAAWAAGAAELVTPPPALPLWVWAGAPAGVVRAAACEVGAAVGAAVEAAGWAPAWAADAGVAGALVACAAGWVPDPPLPLLPAEHPATSPSR